MRAYALRALLPKVSEAVRFHIFCFPVTPFGVPLTCTTLAGKFEQQRRTSFERLARVPWVQRAPAYAALELEVGLVGVVVYCSLATIR